MNIIVSIKPEVEWLYPIDVLLFNIRLKGEKMIFFNSKKINFV